MAEPTLSRRAAHAMAGVFLSPVRRHQIAIAVSQAADFNDLPKWVRQFITAREAGLGSTDGESK